VGGGDGVIDLGLGMFGEIFDGCWGCPTLGEEMIFGDL